MHLARNVLATVNHAHKDMVAATVRTIHAQPDAEATRAQLHNVVGMLEDQFPTAAEILAAAEGDVTAYSAFPRAHWRKIGGSDLFDPTRHSRNAIPAAPAALGSIRQTSGPQVNCPVGGHRTPSRARSSRRHRSDFASPTVSGPARDPASTAKREPQ